MTLELRPLDDALVEDLLAVAIADTAPDEVMPPVDGPPGWTAEREAFFREFHRARFGGLDAEPLRTVMFAIRSDDACVGMIRLSRLDDGACETGMWLARSARGRGLATMALRLAVSTAADAGAPVVRAHTTVTNRAAQATLRRAGATLLFTDGSDQVDAEIPARG